MRNNQDVIEEAAPPPAAKKTLNIRPSEAGLRRGLVETMTALRDIVREIGPDETKKRVDLFGQEG